MTGIEPATSGTTIRRSNRLSYTHQSPLKAYVFVCPQELPAPCDFPGERGNLSNRK